MFGRTPLKLTRFARTLLDDKDAASARATLDAASASHLSDTLDPNKGDALIGFRQSGTGAVARTVHDKLGEFVSVKDFGALGDGVADDTAAIQAAIDVMAASGGGIVRFPQGNYKVTSLVLKANVSLVGQMSIAGTTSDGVWLLGTPGYDVITIDTPAVAGASTTNMSIDGVSISGGDRGIVSYEQTVWLAIRNLRISGPAFECIHVKGFMQELYLEHVDLLGGTYGYRQEAVTGPVTGANSLLDKSLFLHVRASGQSEEGIRIEAVNLNSVTLLRVTCNNTGKHGLYVDAGVNQLQIIDPNFEAIGFVDQGKSVRSTGSIAAGSDTLTVATTSFQDGDILTIAGAGDFGRDLTATVIAGGGTTTLTLDVLASTSVTDAEVINDKYDCIHLNNTNGSNSGITIIGMLGTDGAQNAYTRYGINNRTGGQVQVIGCNPARPVYDPSLGVKVFGGQVNHRTPSIDIYNFLHTSLPERGEKGIIGSPRGGDLIIGLEDSNANGTGTIGVLQVRMHDANRSRLLQVNGEVPPTDMTVMAVGWFDGTSYRFDRVLVGPADSGGTGYRILRVPN